MGREDEEEAEEREPRYEAAHPETLGEKHWTAKKHTMNGRTASASCSGCEVRECVRIHDDAVAVWKTRVAAWR